MKKIIILALMLTVATALSFADEGEQAKAQSQPRMESLAALQTQAQPQSEPRTQEAATGVIKDATLRTGSPASIKGEVESVTPADLLTRPRSAMVITDSAGKTVNFVVKALAVVYDSTGRILTLDNVKQSDKVQVNYITKADRTKEASSIKVLKQ